MTFTAYEVDHAISWATDPDNRSETGWTGLYYGEIRSIDLPSLGTTATFVDRKKFDAGAYDDSPTFVVVKVGDQYFQKEGTYSSWDGSGFYGECVEVEPYEVPLTFYKRKDV